MTTILMSHTVEDYETWKAGFDDHANTRAEYGSPENYHLFREAQTPNEIVILAEWESVAAFQRFMEDSDVREKMDELGVVGEPEVSILEEIESKTAAKASGVSNT
jgi:quinol monooxygenase YgiN